MGIKPLGEYILLRREEEKEHTTNSGLIVMQADNKEQYHGVYAEVLAVSEKVVEDGVLKAGDRVVVNRYDTLPIQWETEKLEMVKAELVYGVIPTL